jgi:type II restriction/modification system DNA methylase subunit YeeA
MPINRNALKKYAPKARRDFIAAVMARAAKFGISDGEPVPMEEQVDVVIIGGEAFPKTIGTQRKALLRRIRLHGFEQTMEEVAYTWFNRFLAIRFMELHGYLDHGYRVLSHPGGGDLPEVIEHAEHLNLVGLDKARVVELKLDGTKDAELYRLLLIAQCNALHGAMPFMFEKIDDETELLLPDNLLHSDSLIRQLVSEIDEADWQEIEIVGWLYQFYISEKKQEVFDRKKAVPSEDIPAATQLFTPNWIVKYMVQNSLGHQWIATYPESSLKDGMEYYINPAEQTEEVQAQLAEITPTELHPEELTLLDPAAGSGHILVEAYDLFKEIYLDRGYRLRDIPRLILEKNLYGLDIDDRAAQMAGFALLMKARADDRHILSDPVHLNVMAIQSSEGLDAADIAKHLLPSGRYELVAGDDLLPDTLAQPTLAADTPGEVGVGTIESLIRLFEDAKTFGSLITVPENIRTALPALAHLLNQSSSGDLLKSQMRQHAVERIRALVEQAIMLGRQYHCVVANPPYLGGKSMNPKVKSFANDHFREAKYDLFACFIDRGFSLANRLGTVALVTMESWMFLSSYEPFRRNLVNDHSIICLGHFPYEGRSPTVMGINFGVSVMSMTNYSVSGYRSHYSCGRSYELTSEGAPKEFPIENERLKNISSEKFTKLPGTPIAYWIEDAIYSVFENSFVLKILGDTRQGMATSDNNRFLRLWHEPSMNDVFFACSGHQEAEEKGKKWFPYNKGGDYRKWYGNQSHVVNWENSGKEIKGLASSLYGSYSRTVKSVSEYFRPSVSWSKVSSGAFSVRYYPAGFIFDVAGCCIFASDDDELEFLSAFLNTPIVSSILKVFSPTLNYEAGAIAKLPIHNNYKAILPELKVGQCIAISKQDWDSFETSWGFQKFMILSAHLKQATTEASFLAWQNQCFTAIRKMKELEEENNRLFIDAYGLQDELNPDVPEDKITLARADQTEDIKRLISYSVGCMMGRYSLAEEGLIYANSGNESFDPTRYGDFPADDDGIVPITDTEWFDDDATVIFEEFLKVAWSTETLSENLKFVGDSLANNGGNDPLKTIRNYLSKGFYKDHLKTYKKRPIYWLFSSGKQRAFEGLVYLHRYNEGTLARMRMEYVTPLQSRMFARIDQLGGDVDSASSSAERNRKQKERDKLIKQLDELRDFDEELRHYADQRITLDLDDGVKVNYGKFGTLLAETKAITGKK